MIKLLSLNLATFVSIPNDSLNLRKKLVFVGQTTSTNDMSPPRGMIKYFTGSNFDDPPAEVSSGC